MNFRVIFVFCGPKNIKIVYSVNRNIQLSKICLVLPRVMKHYSPTGRRNHGRPLKRLLDTWDRNGSTSGPAPWQIYDDDDDDDDLSTEKSSVSWQVGTESSIIICVYFWSRTAVAACVLGQTSVCNSLWPNQFPYLLYCHRHERLINEPAISTP